MPARVVPGLLVALIGLAPPVAGGPKPASVPLLDVAPRYAKGGRLYRNRTADRAGIFFDGERRRGLALAAPGRAGFEIDALFARFTVAVGVPDGAKAPASFRVLGDGRPLAATPPLFPGAEPLALDVDVRDVVLLELAVEGEGALGAWVDARLQGREKADLGRFRPAAVSFSPGDYPASFKRRVNETIDRGVRYLLLQQRKDGSWGWQRHVEGATALVTLALLKAGVPGDDPSIVRAFQFLRRWEYDHVYTASCLLMALEARHFPRGATPKVAVETIPDEDIDWIREASQWLADQQGMGFPERQREFHPVWRYPHGGYDLSNTQYALFGLAAADRCGVRHRRVWLPALRYLIGVQDEDGPAVSVSRYFRKGEYYRRTAERAEARGFGYQARSARTGSMTSAGLCAILLCRSALDGTRRFEEGFENRSREAVRDALAWIEEYYDLEHNPFRGGSWWTYYLFNIERVGVLLDQRYLGTRDWYEEGSELLMARQGHDGRIAGNLIDTSFALLFLKRATVPPLTQGRR